MATVHRGQLTCPLSPLHFLLGSLLQLLAAVSCTVAAGEWVFRTPISESYLAAWANSSFRSPTADLEFLRNTSIAFLGDSLTRYQFIYLAQYLHLRQWEDVNGNKLGSEPQDLYKDV
eukprot:EG_transcript_34491